MKSRIARNDVDGFLDDIIYGSILISAAEKFYCQSQKHMKSSCVFDYCEFMSLQVNQNER